MFRWRSEWTIRAKLEYYPVLRRGWMSFAIWFMEMSHETQLYSKWASDFFFVLVCAFDVSPMYTSIKCHLSWNQYANSLALRGVKNRSGYFLHQQFGSEYNYFKMKKQDFFRRSQTKSSKAFYFFQIDGENQFFWSIENGQIIWIA